MVLVLDVITILVALSLAIDSFSVSITRGLATSHTKLFVEAVTAGFFFGSFQAIMALLGWLAGVNIVDFISDFDHWIAFGLLTVIGGRMIYESTKAESSKIVNSSSVVILLMLSIATSIDALAVGLSYSLLDLSIVLPAISTGIITFSLSFSGVYLGKRIGKRSEKIGILGGILLLGIGIKILTEHLEIFV
jgi:putative Mn2+ efflux pump MntP